jgi:hypothetical protein
MYIYLHIINCNKNLNSLSWKTQLTLTLSFMAEIDDSILEKIQKLLRLQKSAEEIGSLHEANLAAERVTDLLLKYNLELEDIGNHTPAEKTDLHRFNEEDITNPKNEGKWVHALYNILCKYNFCRMIISVNRFDHLKDYAILLGTKDNVESVKFLADQLEERIRSAEKEAWKHNISPEKRNAFRRGFFMGAVRGIDTQLREKRERETQANVKVTSLVLSRDSKMREFMEQQFSNLRQSRGTRTSAVNGYAQGHAHGRNMSINRGVEGSSNQHKAIG